MASGAVGQLLTVSVIEKRTFGDLAKRVQNERRGRVLPKRAHTTKQETTRRATQALVLRRPFGTLTLVLVRFLFPLFLLFAALPLGAKCAERLAKPPTSTRTAIRRQIVRRGNTNKVHFYSVSARVFQKDISLFLTTLAGKVQIIKTQIMKPASSQNRVYSTSFRP